MLRRRDRGSMTVEFALLAPAFVALMLLLVVGGRMVEAQGQVDGAARDAARAASVQTDGSQVQPAVENAALSDLEPAGGRNMCPGGMTATYSGGSAAGSVSVTVRCTINLVVGTHTMTGYAVAPLDTYAERNW